MSMLTGRAVDVTGDTPASIPVCLQVIRGLDTHMDPGNMDICLGIEYVFFQRQVG